MARYEYKVVPAPSKTRRIKGMKTVEDRFAFGMEMLMNDLGAEGWEYLRAETLPCEERSGIRGRTTESIKHMLVFRRSLDEIADQPRALLRDYSSEPPPAQMHASAPAPLQAPPPMRAPVPASAPSMRSTPAPSRFTSPPPQRQGPEVQPPERGPDRGYDSGYSNGYAGRDNYDDRNASFNDRPAYEPDYRERGNYNDRSNGQYVEPGPAYEEEDYGDYEADEFQRPVRGGARRRPPADAPWKMAHDWEDDR